MLIQSHDEVIEILPAIPSSWSSGSVKGIRARGGFIVDFKWRDSIVTNFSITSTVGGKCKVKFDKAFEGSMINELIELDTEAGKTYRLK